VKPLLVVLLAGCAAPMPAWTGGSTTPAHRTDVAAGAAARFGLGKLKRPDVMGSRYREAVEPAGVAPVVAVRHGLTRHHDLGLTLSGTQLRAMVHGEIGAVEGSTRSAWIWGVGILGGWIPDVDGAGSGGRVGIEAPFLKGWDFGGLYDVWIGLRVGAERAFGDLVLDGAPTHASATVLRAGGVFGIAGGFRRVHAFVELAAGYEHWFASHGGRDLSRGGLVLTPSLGLRLRL